MIYTGESSSKKILAGGQNEDEKVLFNHSALCGPAC